MAATANLEHRLSSGPGSMFQRIRQALVTPLHAPHAGGTHSDTVLCRKASLGREHVQGPGGLVAHCVEALSDDQHKDLFQVFTERLCSTLPEVKLLYGTDGYGGGLLGCFASFMAHVVTASRHGISPQQRALLHELFLRHRPCGVSALYVRTAGEELVGALEEVLGPVWTRECSEVWTRVTMATVDAMIGQGYLHSQGLDVEPDSDVSAADMDSCADSTSSINQHSGTSVARSTTWASLEAHLQTIEVMKLRLEDVLRDPILRAVFVQQMRGQVDDSQLRLLADLDRAEKAMAGARHSNSNGDRERALVQADTAVGFLVARHTLVGGGHELQPDTQKRLTADWLSGSMGKAASDLKHMRKEVDISLDPNTWRGFQLYLQVVKCGARVRVDHQIARTKKGKLRVLVIGGGFAGLSIARDLDSDDGISVILVDRKRRFEFSGCLIKALGNPGIYNGVSIEHTRVVKNGTVVVGDVLEVGQRSARIMVAGHGGEQMGECCTVEFDYCVVTTGIEYPDVTGRRGIDGLSGTRQSTLWERQQTLMGAQSVLVVGGGVVGVEMACELKSLCPGKRVVLCGKNVRLVPSLHISCHHAVAERLSELGVEWHTDCEITGVEGEQGGMQRVHVRGGGTFEVDVVCDCAEGVPQTAFLKDCYADALTPMGYIRVGPTLQAIDHPQIFSCGDCAKLPKPEARLAIRAAVQARTVSANIKGLARHGSSAPLAMHKPQAGQYQMVLSLGRREGILYRGDWTTGQGTVDVGEWVGHKFDFVHMVLHYLITGEVRGELKKWLGLE